MGWKLLFCILWFSFPVLAASNWSIYYLANRMGEIDPCGCQVHQVGGLARVQTFLQRQRLSQERKPALLVDSGDAFFPSAQPNSFRRAEQTLKAKLIAESFRKLGMDAFTPGERDFAEGIERLRELEKLSGAVFVSANLVNEKGNLLFERYHVFEKNQKKIAVFGIAGEEAFQGVSGVKVLSPVSTFKAVVAELLSKGIQNMVLLSHQGLTHDREMAALGGVELIVGAHSLDMLDPPERVGNTWIVQPQLEGKQIGFLDLDTESLSKSSSQLVDLDKSFDGDNDVKSLIDGYRDKIRVLALDTRAASEKKSNQPFVAHPHFCQHCHQEQYAFWAGTKHASAYLVLYAKNQHFDPECIGCHSLGFQTPGGFQKIAQPIIVDGEKNKKNEPFIEKLMKTVFQGDPPKTPLDSRTQPERYQKLKKRYHDEIEKLETAGKIRKIFINVQCEHCHGNRNGHPSPSVATLKKVSETSCRGCHTPPNAPNFDPALIPKVACPLMKKG